VATPTQSRSRSPRRFLTRLLIVGSAALVAATVTVPVASADPPVPDTASEAAQLVAQSGRDLEILQEEQNEAQVALDRYIAEAAASTVALGEVNARLSEIDGRVRGVARSAFAGDRLGSFSAILTAESPQEFLDRVNTLEYMSGRDTALLDEATRTRDEATALSEAANASVAASQAVVSDIAARRAALESQIDTYEDLYAQLTTEERAVVGGGASDGGAEVGGGARPPGAIIAPSEAARIAVETAYAQLGDRYVWGAGGPDSFDCSGLTSFAYRAAGVSLPHSSRSQSQMGMAVSRGELQPGDLVFAYSPVSHVGIYVGGGQVIHAYSSGSPVSLGSVDMWGKYSGARRIAGG